MVKLYKYRKVTDKYTTHALLEPDYQEGDSRVTELCELNGMTYVSVPDNLDIPEQPEIINKTLEEVVLTDDLKVKIKAASPHVSLINERVVAQIREQYSVEDEIKLLRLAPSDESSAYNDYVEACRAWGREEKAMLGL